MKKRLLTILIAVIAGPASAHMVWIERASDKTVRAYFGELDHREKSGGLLDKLVPVVFADPAHPLAMSRGEDFIEVAATGDVRLVDERYPPFQAGDDGRMRPMMYARWGRSETQARMAFEFVPTTAGSDSFALVLNGSALADVSVTVIGPDGSEAAQRTDGQGRFTIAPVRPGRYILHASNIDRRAGNLAGAAYDFTARATTLTFTRP